MRGETSLRAKKKSSCPYSSSYGCLLCLSFLDPNSFSTLCKTNFCAQNTKDSTRSHFSWSPAQNTSLKGSEIVATTFSLLVEHINVLRLHVFFSEYTHFECFNLKLFVKQWFLCFEIRSFSCSHYFPPTPISFVF